MRSPPSRELAAALADSLVEGDPALRRAADRYRERLESAWGGSLPEPRVGSGGRAWHHGRLGLVERLFVAESCALHEAMAGLDAGSPARWVSRQPGDLGVLAPWATSPAWRRRLAGLSRVAPRRVDPLEGDPAQEALLALLPPRDRRAIGLHPTPPWVAREVLRTLAPLEPDGPTVDPAAGTGVFLCAALEALWLQAGRPSGVQVWRLAVRLRGVETSPLLAAAASANLECVARRLSGCAPPPGWRAAVYEGDILCDLRTVDAGATRLAGPAESATLEPAALVVGNPPWVAWDRLPSGYKAKLASGPLRALDAFEVHGFSASLGAANDEVSALFVLLGLAHLVRQRGRLAFLLKWNLISNETARVLRRFEVRFAPGSGASGATVPFALEHLVDLRAANPFRAHVEPALFVFRRDVRMGSRVSAERWVRARSGQVHREPAADYGPVNAGDAQGPWAPVQGGRLARSAPQGKLPWPIRHGLKHDCNGVYLVELLRRTARGTLLARNLPELARRISAPSWSGELEPSALRPLVQSRHIRPFRLQGWRHVVAPVREGEILPEEELGQQAPLALRYLESHRTVLSRRRSRVFARPPFYRVFGYGPYCEAPAIVVWSGMGFRPWFAALDMVEDPWLGQVRPLVDSACYLIPCASRQEAYYLSGLLNSPLVRSFLEIRSSRSKRGLARATISQLDLPPFDAQRGAHQELADIAASLSVVLPPASCRPHELAQEQGGASPNAQLRTRADELTEAILASHVRPAH